MEKPKPQMTPEQLEFMKQRQYRILKSMLYKFSLPIKTINQKPPENNFIAYSITNKVSQSGWFSNQRLLAIDCANNQLFYLSKVPQSVLDQSKPLEIQQLRESPYVKHRVSLNSFSKDIKSVQRQDKTLVIQLSPAFVQAGNASSDGKIFWKFQMTSTQLAKDWVNIITMLQRGKLLNPGLVKKTALTPQKHLEMKKNIPNQTPSTPQSITSPISIQIKSQNPNSNSLQKKNKQGEYLTPTNKKGVSGSNNDDKYFKKPQSTEKKSRRGLQDMGEDDQGEMEEFDQQGGNKKSKFKSWNIDQADAKYSQIAEEFNQKDSNIPDKRIKGDYDTRYTPLSQQKASPQATFIDQKTIKQKEVQKNSIGSRLYKKYQVNMNDVIEEEGEEPEARETHNMLTQQFSHRNDQNESIELNVYGDLRSEPNKSGESSIGIKKRIRKNGISPRLSDKQTNGTLRSGSKSPHKGFSGLAYEQEFNIKSPFKKAYSPYKNTYIPVHSLPELSSTYNWNEVYFRILTDYYDCITSYDIKTIKPESKALSFSKHTFIEQKFFDILLKLEKHIEKFELYCSKGIENFVETYILSKYYRSQDEPKSLNSQVKIINEETCNQEESPSEIDSDEKKSHQNGEEESENEKEPLSSKYRSEKTHYKFKWSKKLIEFTYEGIQFFVLLNPIEQIHTKSSKSSAKLSLRQKNLRKMNSDLLFINHLHPFFTETDHLKNINYFHLFSPMLSILEYGGLKFNCKAIFNKSNSKKYTRVLLDHESIEKSKEKHINMNRYIKERLYDTSLSTFYEDNLVDKIGCVYLAKEFGRHTFMVVENLEIDEEDLPPDDTVGSQPTFFAKIKNAMLPPMMEDLEKNFRKQLFLIQKLENNFTHEGSIPLTTHESFQQFLLLFTPYELINKMGLLVRLYDLVKNQFSERHEFLQFSSSYRFLKNPLFLSYVVKLLQNQIIILLIHTEIVVKCRRFLSRVYFKAQELKKHASIPRTNNLKPLFHNVVDQIESLELIFEQFSWNKNKPDTILSLNQNQSFDSPQLNELLIKEIISKAMNELFMIQKQHRRKQGSIQATIKFRVQPSQWIMEETSKYLSKDEISCLDMNYIYEGVMHELGIQRYFDPIYFGTDTLESMMKIARSNKEDVQKLIRDPYYPKEKTRSSMKREPSKTYLSSSNVTEVPRHQYEIDYIPKLADQTQKPNKLPFPIKLYRSIKHSSPSGEYLDPPKIKSDLLKIHGLILQKEFNQAIEIYYLLINSNKKSSSVYYEYFKQVRGNISRPKKDQTRSTPPNSKNINFQHESKQKKHLYHTPALMTYVLATQCVAFSFLKLLYGRNNKLQTGQIHGKSVFKTSGSLQKTQKNQYISLTLKYNVMSHFGTQVIYGYQHIIYMINQLIFGFIRLKNQEIQQAGQHFQQAQRAMEDANDIFLHKSISLPVLYIKALMDLQCRYYRAAIQSLRMLMEAVEAQWNKLKGEEPMTYVQKTYWIEQKLTEMFETQIQDLNVTNMREKLYSFTYLAYEILILCNQNDPNSNIDSNRQIIKEDIVDSLKDFSDFGDSTIKMFQLLWNLQTKIMTSSKRTQVRRAFMKLYNYLINQVSKEKLIRQINIEEFVNPIKKSKHTLPFIFAYVLFNRILAKTEKYWNFLVFEFNSPQCKELNGFLARREWQENNLGKKSAPEHYDIKKELFKEIVMLTKFMLMLGQNFIYQSLANSKHQKRQKKKQQQEEAEQ